MTLQIGMLLFPQITQLDLTGPFELLYRVPDSSVHLAWKDTGPVLAESGMRIVPTTTLKDCRRWTSSSCPAAQARWIC
jgi:cyclohexyl-isocyanide hydratase